MKSQLKDRESGIMAREKWGHFPEGLKKRKTHRTRKELTAAAELLSAAAMSGGSRAGWRENMTTLIPLHGREDTSTNKNNLLRPSK